MFNIMDFPDEVLLKIAYETLPDGIEALSKCSKRFSVISANALIQHEAYKNKYRDIQINEDEGAGPLLTEVVRNPLCAEYTRYANFEYCTEDVRVPLNEDVVKTLTQSLVQQPCIPLTELPQWVRKATLGDHDIIIAMLLLLLPRLETLIIPSTRYCESLIRGAIKWSQESIFRQPKLPLSRLDNITIGNDEFDSVRPGQYFVDHGIKIFQELPSLRSLLCLFRTTRALYNPGISLELCDGSSSLHIFNLELSAEDLETILQHVGNIRLFTYMDSFYSSQTRHLDETLQKYAGGSLEEILLQCVPTPRLEIPNHGFTSLKGFAVLKKVTIPLDTIRTLWNRSSSRPTVVDFLPASVEEVTVVGPTDTGLASLILDELADAKYISFPRLHSVQMSQIKNSHRSVTKVASENAGIVLELDDDEEEDDEEDEEEEDDDEEGDDEEDEDEEDEDEDDEDDEDDAEGDNDIAPEEESE